MLEYNESTGEIERTLATTARAITNERLVLNPSYGGIALSVGDESPVLMRVRELRYNAALQTRVHHILKSLQQGTIGVSMALAELEQVELTTPRYSGWIAALILGLAAAALALLLGGDYFAVATAGVSTAIGLLARQEFGRRHFSLLALPFAASLIGAVFGAVFGRKK